MLSEFVILVSAIGNSQWKHPTNTGVSPIRILTPFSAGFQQTQDSQWSPVFAVLKERGEYEPTLSFGLTGSICLNWHYS